MEKEAQLGADDGMAIEPFHLSPSVQTGASGSFYANHRPQGSITTFNTTHHGSKPSQTTAELKSIIPPSSTSSSRTPAPASAGSQDRPSPSSQGHLVQTSRSDSLPSTSNVPPLAHIQQPVVSEKERHEAEATTAALRPQRLPVPPPEPHVASSGSGSSRMIVHEDSGLRLPRASQGSVVEVPPMYTVG